MLILALFAPHLQSRYLQYHVGNQTVYIRSPQGAARQGSATGFEVEAPSGKIYTLTNAHVCVLQKDGQVLIGRGPNDTHMMPRRVLQVYRDNDLCLVEGMPGYEGLSLALGYDIGDLNYVIGYALGEAQNFSQGYLKSMTTVVIPIPDIAAADCTGPYQSIQTLNTWLGPIEVCTIKRYSIATSISIWPGNSGSAMVNAFGNVTGVVFAGNNETFWGYAVPLEDVITFLKAY